MSKILITYYSQSGSTKEIAGLIAGRLPGSETEIMEVDEIKHLNYDNIIIGTPNLYGKPASKICNFLKQNKRELANIPLAFYFTCMDCYDITYDQKPPFSIFKDSHFHNNVKDLGTMNSWEISHSISSYTASISKIAPELNIVAMAFFKGRLRFKNLSLVSSLVMRFICLINKNIKEGDYYKAEDAHDWCTTLSSVFKLDKTLINV